MPNGIVIHIVADEEKRTEFFVSERVRLGSDETCDLQLEPPPGHELAEMRGVWLELERAGGFYRVADLNDALKFQHNKKPLLLKAKLDNGDLIVSPAAEISFQFFSVPATGAMVSSKPSRDTGRIAPFIENAAIESAASPKRDDAKVFLREFTRELVREISLITKLIVLAIVIGALSGVFYLGFSVYKEMQRTREVSEDQGRIISALKDELTRSRDEIGELGKSNKRIIDIVSLAPTLRNEYGNGVCLLVGTYDLVEKQSNRLLRYPDPTLAPTPDPYEPPPAPVSEDGGEAAEKSTAQQKPQSPLTTEGGGSPVEFDFVGTGFHVGGGYILTNRHVVQPWASDERVKVLTQLSNGRARLRRLVVYFPGFPNPFPLRVRDVSTREDLAVGSLDPNSVFPDIPVLPLDPNSDAIGIGKTVVSMGYPNGPDRILAMVDDAEARSIQARYGSTLQTLINFLAQSKRIQPLTTQGAITDLDTRRVVHDAKTAEGGSGAPLFGQSGRVIGVNFGVFTENTAANMAVPIRYAIPLLQRAGWKSPEQKQQEAEKTDEKAANINTTAKLGNTSAANNTVK
ncbi:MAG TPA: serine protease [Pyrinomonadaceae bacterium]|jgi:S1-C subfamily serine protease|nr:serine protease [Pyrinomonadaceae bacterium]